MEPQTQTGFVPPYNIPWTTFLSTLEKIAADPPSRVDRSYLDSQSGNVQTYLIAAFKSFGLIDQDARPTRINEFADPAARKPKMAELLREYYPTMVELGTTKATNDELREAFTKEFPTLTGESRVKAIRFFLSAMAYAELPVSSLWSSVKAPRGASAKSGPRKATPRKAARANNGGDNGGQQDQPGGGGGTGEVVVVNLGDAGRVTVHVDVRWLQLSEENFVALRKAVGDLKALAAANQGGES
jgi:Family of unknown function (DUF5343)